MQDKLVRIGVFYDGNYFFQVSNFYNYDHPRRSRISVAGLHDFIRNHVADAEDTEAHYCKIVDAHYFRGRLSAQEASQKGDTLYWERVFDDILMSEGITTHYLPVRRQQAGRREDHSLEIWMALEAYEMSLHKRFDVLVLITAEADYIPLVRRLNTIGTRVMILSWDFDTTNMHGQRVSVRTPADLLKEVSYPVSMMEIVDDKELKDEPLITGLFVKQEPKMEVKVSQDADGEDMYESEVMSLKNGYGFIKYPPNNLFFHYSDLLNADFNDVFLGDRVSFKLTENEKGDPVASEVTLLDK